MKDLSESGRLDERERNFGIKLATSCFYIGPGHRYHLTMRLVVAEPTSLSAPPGYKSECPTRGNLELIVQSSKLFLSNKFQAIAGSK